MIINLPKLGPVKFRDELSDAEIQQQIKALAQKYDFTLPKPDVGIGTLLKRGFMRGLGETGIALGDVVPAMIGSAIGADEYAAKQMQEAKQSREALQAKYPQQFESVREIGGPYEALQYGAETIGELGPSVLTSLIPGVGLGAAGTRLAGQAALRGAMAAGPAAPAAIAAAKQVGEAAGRRAMYGGVYLGSLSQTAPEIFQGIYKETGEMEPGISALAGGIASVLDSVLPAKLLSNLGAFGKLKVVEQIAKETGAAPKVWKYIRNEAAKAAGTEGLTEAAQETIGATAEQIAGSTKDFFSKENFDRFSEAFVKGAIGGGAFGAVGGVGQGLQARGAYKKEQRDTQEAEAALQAQMDAEQAAGTLTKEKKAQYDAALAQVRAQREKELTEAFAGLPEFNKQQAQYAKDAEAALQEQMAAEQAAGTLTKEKKAQYDAAIRQARAERLAGLKETFAGLPDYEKQKIDATREAEAALQAQLDAEQAAGTLTKEKKAQYEEAIKQARAERKAALVEAFAGLPEFQKQQAAKRAPIPTSAQMTLPGMDIAELDALDKQYRELRAETEKTGQGDLFSGPFTPGKPVEPAKPTAPTTPAAPAIDLATVTKIDDPKAFGKALGIGSKSNILPLLAGKDISNPADAKVVYDALNDYAQRRTIPPGAAAKIEEFLNRPEFKGVSDVDGTVTQPTGTSTDVAGQPTDVAPTGTTEPTERGGVGSAVQPAGEPQGTTETQPSAIGGSKAVSFTTEKGSTYTVDAQGRTARTKRSPGRGQGQTYAPHTALYVQPGAHTDILSDMQAGMGANSVRLGYSDGKVFTPVQNVSDIPAGVTPVVGVFNKKSGAVVGIYPAQVSPTVGLHPVEKLYSPDGTASTHVGNKIVEVKNEAATQPDVPPTEPSAVTEGAPTQTAEGQAAPSTAETVTQPPTTATTDVTQTPEAQQGEAQGQEAPATPPPASDAQVLEEQVALTTAAEAWADFADPLRQPMWSMLSPVQQVAWTDAVESGQPTIDAAIQIAPLDRTVDAADLWADFSDPKDQPLWTQLTPEQQQAWITVINGRGPSGYATTEISPPKPPPADIAGNQRSLSALRTDMDVVQERLGKSRKKLNEVERAAHAYFSKVIPELAIQAVAHDLALAPTAYRNALMVLPSASVKGAPSKGLLSQLGPEPFFGNQAEAAFFMGQGGKNAANAALWIRSNLSAETVARFESLIDYYTRQMQRKDDYLRWHNERQQQRLEDESDVIDGEDLIREVRDTKFLQERTQSALTPEEVQTLENEYGAPSGSSRFLSKLRADVVKYVQDGANAVASSIRSIIKAVVTAMVAAGFIFNPNFVSNSEAVVVHTPTVSQAVSTVQVPPEVAARMSDAGQLAYKTLFSAIKNDLQQADKFLIIADKPTARMFVFNPDGSLLMERKTLFGAAVGDYLKGSNVLPENRITPAGLFNLGLRAGGKTASDYDFKKVFVLDKAIDGEYSVTIMHSVWLKESDAKQRMAALKTGAADDARFSFGCINVDRDSYEYLIKNHESQMDGAKLFVVPDNQAEVKDFLTGKVNKDGLTREQVPLSAGLKNTLGLNASLEQAMLHKAAHPVIIETLKAGNFEVALGLLADSTRSGFYAQVARKLMPLMKGVKVTVGGDQSSYDPATNTITLRDGATDYEILHEGTHAALSHVLDNASHPVTQQLKTIFNAVRGSVDGAYGATNLQEFAAEIWSNDDLRSRLQAYVPNGQKMSLWDRFMNAMRRWLGFPTKTESAVDRVDRLLNEIISVPPMSRTGDTLFAQSMTNPHLARDILRGMGDTMSKLPAMNETRATQFLGKLEGLTSLARQQAYRLLNLPQLAEVSERVLGPGAKKFAENVSRMEGFQHTLLERMQPLNNRLQEFTQDPKYAEFSALVHETTIPDVNPMREHSSYQNQPDKYALWPEFNRRYRALGPKGMALFKDLFATYKQLDKLLEESLKFNISAMVPDQKDAMSAYQKIMLKLAETRIDHYAPLYREGIFWLNYELDGKTYRPAFTSAVERDAALRQVEAQGATNIESFSRVEEMNSRNMPDGTMLAAIVDIMKKTGAGAEAIDQLTLLVVKALPETSILKSRQRRQGTPGYIDNAAYVFSRASANSAQQLARMRYGESLMNNMKEMAEAQSKLRGMPSAYAKELYEEFVGRRKYAMNPDVHWAARYASAGAYYFNIAGNISSAVVQTLQTPMVTMPHLGGEYGFAKAGRALLNALNMYRSSGMKRATEELTGETSERQAMLSIENLLSKGLGGADKYRGLITALKDQGLLQTTTVHEALRSEKELGERMVNTSGKLREITNFITNGLFHHSERMNREISAVAAFDLEMDRLKSQGVPEAEREARAIEKAIRVVQYTHGASGSLSGPGISQTNIGRVLTVFKRFAFSMYYMLFDTIFRALPRKGATAEQQRMISAARRQLAGVYGMAALFAGAKGVPLYWIAELAYNAFQDEDDDDFDTVMRKLLGEFLYKGPINYVTNLSIADRVGWTDLIFREAKGDKTDASFMARALESALGAPYAMVDSIDRARDLIAEGHLGRGIEAALPVALRNVLKGFRYSTEGANTLRGDPVMGEIGGYNAAMQVLGFAPADLIRQYEENAYGKSKDKAITDQVKKNLKRYYIAMREGDTEAMNKAEDRLYAIGDKYPELGISPDMLRRSVKARDKISDEMYLHHGVTYSKKLRPVIEQAIGELQ